MLDYQSCSLCLSASPKIKDDNYYLCPVCQAVFLDKNLYLSPEAEKQRYQSHNNDVYDERYRQFVLPITSAILQEQARDSLGLDFGSGTGPVISTILQEQGYNILQYDLFFANNPELLTKEYDYLVCCEVVEHFKDSKKEFALLKKLLKPGGCLYIMTDIYNSNLDFKNWYYRQDPTHVFIYSQETFQYICKTLEFSSVNISGRLVIFRK